MWSSRAKGYGDVACTALRRMEGGELLANRGGYRRLLARHRSCVGQSLKLGAKGILPGLSLCNCGSKATKSPETRMEAGGTGKPFLLRKEDKTETNALLISDILRPRYPDTNFPRIVFSGCARSVGIFLNLGDRSLLNVAGPALSHSSALLCGLVNPHCVTRCTARAR
jgi:hypothetical protein